MGTRRALAHDGCSARRAGKRLALSAPHASETGPADVPGRARRMRSAPARHPAHPAGGAERGLWRLRRATARRFGLVVNAHRDDRVHPERATRAAAHYLRLLHDRYGDWALALAAYNAGERRVDRALARDPEASFWRLAERGYLPHTSREYVPRFYALLRMAGEREPTALGSAL